VNGISFRVILQRKVQQVTTAGILLNSGSGRSLRGSFSKANFSTSSEVFSSGGSKRGFKDKERQLVVERVGAG
jgi:hypothetical protein